MKSYFILLFLLLVNFSTLAQKVYRQSGTNEDFYGEFIVFKDSTCFWRGHYLNNSMYYLFKGKIKRINDTLYDFKYQPIVDFGCNMRLGLDTMSIGLTQIDTILLQLDYKVRLNKGKDKIVNLRIGDIFDAHATKLHLKGIDKYAIYLDTKFIDPLTKKKITMSISPHSEPYLTYYGTKTVLSTVKISIVGNCLIRYADRSKEYDRKEKFILVK